MLNKNTLSKMRDKMRNKHNLQLEKIKLKNELDLEKIKLKNDVEIEQNELHNKLVLSKLHSSKNQMNTKREIFQLSNLINKDKLTIRAGKMLKLWVIIVTLISTIVTIAGGYKTYVNSPIKLIAFIFSIIVLQFTVFIIASQETRIKQEFFNHAWKCSLLKYSLLTVSIYNNYEFFKPHNHKIIQNLVTLMLCISLDMIAIFLVGLAYDQITLNTFKPSKKPNLNINIISKLMAIILHKFTSKIDDKYNSLKNIATNDRIDTSNSHSILHLAENTVSLPLTVTKEEINKYLQFIKSNVDSHGFVPAYKDVAKQIGISRNKAHDIKKYLDSIGTTTVFNKRTKLVA